MVTKDAEDLALRRRGFSLFLLLGGGLVRWVRLRVGSGI